MISVVAILVCGLAIGLAIGWFVGATVQRGKSAGEKSLLERDLAGVTDQVASLQSAAASQGVQFEALRTESSQLRSRLAGLEATLGAEQDKTAAASAAHTRADQKCEELQARNQRLGEELAQATTQLVNERKQGTEKVALLNEAREQLTYQFKTLASEILEEKSKRFTELNQSNLGQLLDPLKLRLSEFQAKVEQVQQDGIAGRTELKSHLDNLQKLNQQLSDDAANLVTALRGSSKTQGDWGEFILEQILESSGLRKGIEYRLQESFALDNNRRARPDVVVNLPGGKHLVLDSKVSLVAYTDYCSGETDAQKSSHLSAHLASVRAHISGLAKKDYHQLYGLKSLDFVVMFIPVEPAFMLAIGQDCKLWQEAYNKNVLLVSPTTLLFVIRTVANLWRQENQTRNVNEIVNRGSLLYDKFVGFAADMEKIGERLQDASSTYDSAFQKLKTGPGNLVRQVELLRDLGLKPKRNLQPSLLEEAFDQPLSLSEASELEDEGSLESDALADREPVTDN